MKTIPKSSTRWDASTYECDWRQVISLLNSRAFILDIVSAINLPKDASVLEIGIGSGKWSCAFSIMGYKVTAMDNNPEMLEQAKRNFPNIRIEYVLDDLLNLTSEASKRKYELVTNEGVLEHVLDRDERISAIRAMGNCCISGGYVYFFVPFLSDEPDEHRYTSVKEMHDELVAAKLKPYVVDIIGIETGVPGKRKIRQMLRVVGKREAMR